MSKVYFTSDLHFGHKNIGKYREILGLDTEEKSREAICKEWSERITKRDTVWVLGDCCFEPEFVKDIACLPGRKRLVLGNHDIKDIRPYFECFDYVYGIRRYKNFWLSHAPIADKELRGCNNIHGHIHMDPQISDHHFNASCDFLKFETGSFFADLEYIRTYFRAME